ncbi:MAG: aminotransferase class III-fold pyridoxal phosphate-dependent enzyme [Actinobacteria bacterium]|nr:aminotransferase class III-fold pyridoxal phosphate-dependent enzyme [Actinomycetota bacterium]
MDREHVIYSWSRQGGLDPLEVTGGEGCWFTDAAGHRYLDFASQVMNLNLGHRHPRLVEALRRQAETLYGLAPSFASAPRSELARLVAEVTPGDLGLTLFTTGGAEANENAVKLARWVTGRHKVVARYRSYHGATAGAASLTGDPRRWPSEPAVPGVVRMLDVYPYRCPAGHHYDVSGADALDPAAGHAGQCAIAAGGPHLEDILRFEGPESVAAVILESVPGANGVLVPPPGYLAAIREVCDRYGVLFILDEVMTGFGRTGRWFACEHWDVTPDIMTLAKGMSGGAVPLGAMVVSEKLRPWLEEHEFASGLTACGHPLACAAGVATIAALRDERLVENAAAVGEVLREGMLDLADDHRSVGEVRGLGLLWGIELVRDGQTREPLVPYAATGEAAEPMAALRRAALDRGLHVYTHGNVLLVAPPLIVGRDEIATGLDILDDVLALADGLAD